MRRPIRGWAWALVLALVLLAGCTGTTAATAPTSTAPPVNISPASVPPATGSTVTAPTPVISTDAAGAAADPTTTPATVPAESDVWIPAGDHRVPGTLALPAAAPGQRAPAVLLLHGDLSSRDENNEIFRRLAAALAARGIASLRIDFAGSGDSEEPDLALDYPNMVADATASLAYLDQQSVIDPSRVALLGLSRGAAIAATMAGTLPGVAALVSWSGAIYNGFDEDPGGHQEARDNGYQVVDLGDREFDLSLAWFDTIQASHPLDDVAGYPGPVLAVVGSDDDVVPPEVSDDFLARVASTDKTLHTIDGADHGFGAEPGFGDEAIAVTTDWLVARLLR